MKDLLQTLAAAGRLAPMIVEAAWKLVLTRVRDWKADRRLGIRTAERVDFVYFGVYTKGRSNGNGGLGRHGDSSSFQATDYERLGNLANYLRLGESDVFLDVGCGAGRTICFMAERGAGKCVGLDVSEELVSVARVNAAEASRRLGRPIEVHLCDAAEIPEKILDEATVLYLFNPFGFLTLRSMVDALQASLERRTRGVTVVYFYAQHRWYLDSKPWLKADEALTATQNMAIWRSRPVNPG
jgi:SAM-dependent methyltransferase